MAVKESGAILHDDFKETIGRLLSSSSSDSEEESSSSSDSGEEDESDEGAPSCDSIL